MTSQRSAPQSPARRRSASWLLVAAVIAFLIVASVGWGQLSFAEAERGAVAAPPTEPLVREVLLLIDSSADVDPAAQSTLRAAASAVLDELGPRDLFNVIAFGSRPRALYPGSWPAVPQSRDKARRFVAALDTGGERSVLSAAEAALAPTPEGYRPARIVRDSDPLPRHVLLLTSRPAEDAAALAGLQSRLPSSVRLDVIPATPTAAQSARSLLHMPEPVALEATLRVVADEAADPTVAPGGAVPAAPSAPLNRALLAAALALPIFLAALGWTVRRGLASGPVSN